MSPRFLSPRTNPFRVDSVLRVRYMLTEHEWAALLDQFARNGSRAALVGPMGSGKTTLREDMEHRLRLDGYGICAVHLNRDTRRLTADMRRRIADADHGTIVTVDGAEQMGWVAWRWLLHATRNAGGLLATLHQPRRGLAVLREHCTSAEMLRQIVGQLVGDSGTYSLDNDLGELYSRYTGNIRDCLRELYDRWAEAPQRSSCAV